jgi:hypothetical protein
MGCSFGSPAGAVVIRFRILYAPQNLNRERLPEKPHSVNNECKEEKEHTMKTLVVGTLALVFVLGFGAGSFARNSGGSSPAAGGSQERSMDRTRADGDKDRDHLKKDNEHSNKGSKVRGLNRADQVAGEHGDKGRDKAEQKQDK